jgi:uncharacterized protein (TIGR00251 family)
MLGEEVKICLAAPPVDGKANQGLAKFLASVLSLRKEDVTILAGASSRHKIVRIEGMAEEELRERLGPILAGSPDRSLGQSREEDPGQGKEGKKPGLSPKEPVGRQARRGGGK